MSEFSGPYQLAADVAKRIIKHPGSTPRQLYQEYLPEFAAFNCDGTAGSAMIRQHLLKMEADGIARCERGPKKTSPAAWFSTKTVTTDQAKPLPAESIEDEAPTISIDSVEYKKPGPYVDLEIGQPVPDSLIAEAADMEVDEDDVYFAGTGTRAHADINIDLTVDDITMSFGYAGDFRPDVEDRLSRFMGLAK